ncbi:hypothetical protein BCR36DRAFT_374070 [Piromyces finnis]|uniref:Uncharacterized protein n=1 Tax=Piromyces finnis TaxID=1754191 RepID=A0A1Y1UXV8_9FUNG|nr:hypothetical protein BCR36DRAFT_374070 [Piromyces finnis]|eukprot:ORX43123.1 hypothetical protein BCR36DRAFT_374070 [Piromyces finnis]
MSNTNSNGQHTEMVEKLLDLLTQLEEQGNTIINDIKGSTQNPIIKERMKVSQSKYETIIQFIDLHSKIGNKEAEYNNKIYSLAHDLNEISKTNQTTEKKNNI